MTLFILVHVIWHGDQVAMETLYPCLNFNCMQHFNYYANNRLRGDIKINTSPHEAQ